MSEGVWQVQWEGQLATDGWTYPCILEGGWWR
jgi:hypothetical protein